MVLPSVPLHPKIHPHLCTLSNAVELMIFYMYPSIPKYISTSMPPNVKPPAHPCPPKPVRATHTCCIPFNPAVHLFPSYITPTPHPSLHQCRPPQNHPLDYSHAYLWEPHVCNTPSNQAEFVVLQCDTPQSSGWVLRLWTWTQGEPWWRTEAADIPVKASSTVT